MHFFIVVVTWPRKSALWTAIRPEVEWRDGRRGRNREWVFTTRNSSTVRLAMQNSHTTECKVKVEFKILEYQTTKEEAELKRLNDHNV
jgi:hypothetical protein